MEEVVVCVVVEVGGACAVGVAEIRDWRMCLEGGGESVNPPNGSTFSTAAKIRIKKIP